MDKVFSTVELLEAILLRVPQRDLLLSQAVCQMFRDTIKGSIKLQQMLFFAPETALDSTKPTEGRVNDLLYDIANANTRDSELQFRSNGRHLSISEISCYTSTGDWNLLVPPELHINVRNYFKTGKSKDGTNWRPQSWDKMYLCQPPCEFRVSVFLGKEPRVFVAKATTMKDIMERCAEELEIYVELRRKRGAEALREEEHERRYISSFGPGRRYRTLLPKFS